MDQIDLNNINLCHAATRLRQKTAERLLLLSIIDQGVKSSLLGVRLPCGDNILLDGFKRFRAAKTVCHISVPFESLGGSVPAGIFELLRRSGAMSLHILEQAAFITSLIEDYGLSAAEIARRLDKSKAWVSLRQHLLKEMSPGIKDRIFRDEFPAYAYMHILQPFIRVNEADPKAVECFVIATSGKKLSVREIERLAYAYFKGPPEFKTHIDKGEMNWAIKRSQGLFRTPSATCSGVELSVLQDLELFSHSMRRLQSSLVDDRLKDPSFFCQANLLSGRILEDAGTFIAFLRGFYDRSRAPEINLPPAPVGFRDSGDLSSL